MTTKIKDPRLLPRGARMRPGSGWRLYNDKFLFVGTLLWTYSIGPNDRIAMFSVPKRKPKVKNAEGDGTTGEAPAGADGEAVSGEPEADA